MNAYNFIIPIIIAIIVFKYLFNIAGEEFSTFGKIQICLMIISILSIIYFLLDFIFFNSCDGFSCLEYAYFATIFGVIGVIALVLLIIETIIRLFNKED